MRAVLQRVTEASVTVAGEVIGQIGPGLLVLVCAMPDDTPDSAAKLAERIARLRIFADDSGRMNLSVTQTGGAVLAVSQFTLAADTRRGNRPGFTAAAPPDLGERLYEDFTAALRALGLPVACGRFGADMQIRLLNDGPVTIWIES